MPRHARSIAVVLLLAWAPAVALAQSPRAAISTLDDLFAAIRECWVPPPLDRARDGMQITVVFSLTRRGEIFGQVGVSFESPDATDDDRLIYRKSIAEALHRCTPLPITDGLGNAIAGKPFRIRFVDERRRRQVQSDHGSEVTEES